MSASIIVISLALVCAAFSIKVSTQPEQVADTDWVLFAHGSTRFRHEGNNNDWTAKYTGDNIFHYPYWMVPFGEGPNQAGGVNIRTSDGTIHVPLLGNTRYGGSPNWPAGGATRDFAPLYVWEIDGNTGESKGMYDFSGSAGLPRVDCPNSVLRYTADGSPIIAGYTSGRRSVYILDKEDKEKVTFSLDSVGYEPMLLQVTNTNPPQLLWAGLNGNSGFTLTGGNVPDLEQFVSTSTISTLIFGTDGETLYNNQFFNGPQGIQIFDLPLTNSSKEKGFFRGCYTKPWLMASDTSGNMFSYCQSDQSLLSVEVVSGAVDWTSKISAVNFLVLSDDETVLVAGTSNAWTGYSPKSGEQLWHTVSADLGTNLHCNHSSQPWSPRHPIPLNGEYMAILCCATGGVDYRVVVLSLSDGSVVKTVPLATKYPEMLAADAGHNVFVFGLDAGKPVVEKKSLGL